MTAVDFHRTLPPKEIPWCSILLQAKRAPGLMNEET